MLNYKMTVGSRAQVWHGTADRTSGGLTKKDLFKGKDGRIKSRRASALAKKNKTLEKAGYRTEKGKFGAVKVDDAKSPRRSARRSSPRRSARRSSTGRSARRTTSPRRSARRATSPRRAARRSPRRSAGRSSSRRR